MCVCVWEGGGDVCWFVYPLSWRRLEWIDGKDFSLLGTHLKLVDILVAAFRTCFGYVSHVNGTQRTNGILTTAKRLVVSG